MCRTTRTGSLFRETRLGRRRGTLAGFPIMSPPASGELGRLPTRSGFERPAAVDAPLAGCAAELAGSGAKKHTAVFKLLA